MCGRLGRSNYMENHALPQSQSSAGDPRDGTVVGGQRRGKFGKFSHSGRVTSKLYACKTGSAYTGRVVNGISSGAVFL